MMRLLDLAGRTAVVTSSSAGIGRAVSAALMAQGCSVHGLDVAPPPSSTSPFSKSSSSSSSSATFTHISCDLRSPTSIQEAINAHVSPTTGGSLDYVVNVAGRDPKFSIDEGSEVEWEDIINLNLRGQYLLIRACTPLMERGSGKSVVNIASINYKLGVPRRTIYTVSKNGVLGLTRGLARELGGKGIRINTVSPGWVFTQIQKEAYFDDPVDGPKYLAYLEGVQSLPKKRISPEDVANHVLFLLSSVSGATTGSNHVVDAGWLLE